jgi:hypothetical protein
MAGTKEGAAKAAKTNKEKYGEDFYKNIGAKSWDNPERSHETGFALLPKKVRAELGRKGGKKNKGKKYAKKEVVYLTPKEAAEEIHNIIKLSTDVSE